MIALSIAAIARAVSGRIVGDFDPALVVAGTVQTDSRLVRPGDTFFALPGEVTDGHLYAAPAVQAGAALVVVERVLDLAIPQILVASGVAALAALATHVVETVRAEGLMTVIAVTGSNGKTTTKNMLQAICSDHGETVAPEGSFNNYVGAPISMLRITARTRFLIVEAGASGPGEIARIAAMAPPDVAIELKVGLAHAGGFRDIESTAAAKAELVTGLGPKDTAVLNADDLRVAQMAALTSARIIWFTTQEGEATAGVIRGTDIAVTMAGTQFRLQIAGEPDRAVRLRILGEHQVPNALAALSTAHTLGLDIDRAIAALSAMDRAERWRMEVLLPEPGITVINDAYNASPDSMAAALKTLAQLTASQGRSVAVLGEMAELGEIAREEHDRIGRLSVRLNIGRLIVVGWGARHIHAAAGLEGSWDGESVYVADAEEAYDVLHGTLRPGDVVLVKSSKSAGLRFLGDRIGGVSA